MENQCNALVTNVGNLLAPLGQLAKLKNELVGSRQYGPAATVRDIQKSLEDLLKEQGLTENNIKYACSFLCPDPLKKTSYTSDKATCDATFKGLGWRYGIDVDKNAFSPKKEQTTDKCADSNGVLNEELDIKHIPLILKGIEKQRELTDAFLAAREKFAKVKPLPNQILHTISVLQPLLVGTSFPLRTEVENKISELLKQL